MAIERGTGSVEAGTLRDGGRSPVMSRHYATDAPVPDRTTSRPVVVEDDLTRPARPHHRRCHSPDHAELDATAKLRPRRPGRRPVSLSGGAARSPRRGPDRDLPRPRPATPAVADADPAPSSAGVLGGPAPGPHSRLRDRTRVAHPVPPNRRPRRNRHRHGRPQTAVMGDRRRRSTVHCARTISVNVDGMAWVTNSVR